VTIDEERLPAAETGEAFDRAYRSVRRLFRDS
jgi:hypothetical protein